METPPSPPPPAFRSWILERLDSLLSESLRQGSPTDLVRYRLVVGTACFFIVFNLIYTMAAVLSGLPPYPSLAASLIYVGVLVLTRRSATIESPTALLLTALSLVLIAAAFDGNAPFVSTHAICTLIPVIAVYLSGARVGLFITLLLIVPLCVGYPLYVTFAQPAPLPPTPYLMWFGHVFAGLALLGAWGVGSLHNAARDSAQGTLERTMKALQLSENKLSNLLESTEDPVLSLDKKGLLLTANSAARQLHLQRFGHEPGVGQPFWMEPERRQRWAPHVAKVHAGQRERFEDEFEVRGSRRLMDISLSPLRDGDGKVVGLTVFARDITPRRQAEARLGELHRTLLDVSRQAGMAEIATGVLHNVGNTLNSVNVSTSLVMDRLRLSRVSSVGRAAQLLHEHTGDLPTFFTRDPRGQQFPAFLQALSEQLEQERNALLKEMHSLSEGVEHIKSIVSMQQRHASSAGVREQVAMPVLIDEALRLHAASFEQLGIHVERDYAPVPLLSVDRHKLLQILVNLLSNARHALMDSPRKDKRLSIGIQPAPDGERVLIEVKDNGVGIAPENLPRLFTQGFTTKRTGHGFGLHMSALAAEELRGRLTCDSPGPGQGATFTLELPLAEEPGPRPVK
ncbi:PAS domain S-box-containing protein [Archangium gephyra]|uniref:histidine kinase n=1 Tax=Archangium gephyra TaxID=48 RepID=A0AAC8QA82_9BACT|nr:ATP-binding protein [Archangium gephyra]AKJ03903.1 sensor histidine kinase [Archangium gephyra]REG23679.1 PAS domain S-box-containing protein [Archangium gephyra]